MNSLRSVAEKAGVSSCTVSKVLNGVPSRITPATRDRVLSAATDLGYQPNRFARGLNKRRTQTIGLLISGLQNPYFVSLAEEAERQFLAAGYQVILDAAPPLDETYRQPARLRSLPLDGALMQGTESRHVSDYLGAAAFDLPTVYLGSERNDGEEGVYLDYRIGAAQTAAHFAEQGYRRVAFVTNAPAGVPTLDPRFLGFTETCVPLGLAVEVISTDYLETRAAGYRIGEAIARRPAADRPRAVCCHNDLIAIGVCRALQRGGLRVPQDVAVSGFDHIEDGQYLEAPLTTVAGSLRAMLEAAATRLLGRIERGDPPTGEQIAVPTQLIMGGTT